MSKEFWQMTTRELLEVISNQEFENNKLEGRLALAELEIEALEAEIEELKSHMAHYEYLEEMNYEC